MVKRISLLVRNVLQISLFKNRTQGRDECFGQYFPKKAISVYLKIEHRTEMFFFLANTFQKRLSHYQNDQSNRTVQTLVSFPGGECLHTRSKKRFFNCTLYPRLVNRGKFSDVKGNAFDFYLSIIRLYSCGSYVLNTFLDQ